MRKYFIGFIPAVFLLSSCATGIFTPTGPALFASYKDSVMATSNPGEKTGRACSRNFAGLAALGDSSIEEAKKEGSIAQVASVDREILSILFLYGQNCTIVTGR